MQEERIELLTPWQEKFVLAAMYVPLPAFLLFMLLLAIGIAGPLDAGPWLMVFALIGVYVFFVSWLVRSLGLCRPKGKRAIIVAIGSGLFFAFSFVQLSVGKFFFISYLTHPLVMLTILALPFALFLAPRYRSRYGR